MNKTVDANHLAIKVKQRSSGVAAIEGGIVPNGASLIHFADDSFRDGFFQGFPLNPLGSISAIAVKSINHSIENLLIESLSEWECAELGDFFEELRFHEFVLFLDLQLYFELK
jgi:hypothetical protein